MERANRKKKLGQKLQSIGLESAPLVPDQIVLRDEVREVLKAAERLRPRDIEILRLALWEELDLGAIAEILQINSNAAKQRLHRAKKNLIKEHERTHPLQAQSPAAQKGGEW